MRNVCGMLLMAILLVFASVLPVHAGPFEGEWVGHWKNDLGERGHDTLTLYESHHRHLEGTWSGDTRVRGEQTGEHSMRLHGRRDDGVRYDITAHKRHGEIYIEYTAIRPDGSSYKGWSELRRR